MGPWPSDNIFYKIPCLYNAYRSLNHDISYRTYHEIHSNFPWLLQNIAHTFQASLLTSSVGRFITHVNLSIMTKLISLFLGPYKPAALLFMKKDKGFLSWQDLYLQILTCYEIYMCYIEPTLPFKIYGLWILLWEHVIYMYCN